MPSVGPIVAEGESKVKRGEITTSICELSLLFCNEKISKIYSFTFSKEVSGNML